MIQNAACEIRSFRRREVETQSRPLHLFKGFANFRIGHASEKPDFTVVPTIGSDSFTDSVVSIRVQQASHHLLKRRPDRASYVEGFIRFMSKGPQWRKAACQNAGERIDQRAVEVEK